jgi:tRNA nucleotidyltransferase/poly(A) polymerase
VAKDIFSNTDLDAALRPYRGRWVAFLAGQVVAEGGTRKQVWQALKSAQFAERPQVFYVPLRFSPRFSPVFSHLQELLGKEREVYLVGGAVRDALLNRPTRDLDFVLPREAMSLARQIADHLRGAYFPLDEERETARVIFMNPDETRQVLDFATFRGESLEEDLRARDFTINAIAVSLANPDQLLDPLNGVKDLQQSRLRSCSAGAFRADPLRILRAARLAVQFDLQITPDTIEQIKAAAPTLPQVSEERTRDELFRILETDHPAPALKSLQALGVFPFLPLGIQELSPLVSRVIHNMALFFLLLVEEHDPERAANWTRGLLVNRLGRYRAQISAHLQRELVPERALRPLVGLAALHLERIGQQQNLIAIAENLRLSRTEIRYLRKIALGVPPVRTLLQQGAIPDRRAVYRYYKDRGEAGIDALFLALAEFLALEGEAPPEEKWVQYLNTARILAEAWWEKRQEWISPAPLVDGNQLMEALGLSPGPQIGELLDAIQEEQAVGAVSTREEALNYARQVLKR